jgi:hypothetical protein
MTAVVEVLSSANLVVKESASIATSMCVAESKKTVV